MTIVFVPTMDYFGGKRDFKAAHLSFGLALLYALGLLAEHLLSSESSPLFSPRLLLCFYTNPW